MSSCNDDWRDELKDDNYPVWERLAECRNTEKDILVMAKLLYKYNSGKTREDCLDRIIEWVTDWNNQYNIDFTEDEYNELLAKM